MDDLTVSISDFNVTDSMSFTQKGGFSESKIDPMSSEIPVEIIYTKSLSKKMGNPSRSIYTSETRNPSESIYTSEMATEEIRKGLGRLNSQFGGSLSETMDRLPEVQHGGMKKKMKFEVNFELSENVYQSRQSYHGGNDLDFDLTETF